jgi:hypothetical protein
MRGEEFLECDKVVTRGGWLGMIPCEKGGGK